MSWFKIIPDKIKNQILTNIKDNGKTVAEMAKENSVAIQTIYKWLKNDTEYQSNNWWYTRSAILEINRLKKEKKEMIEVVGKLTLLANKIKKKDLIFEI